MVQYKNKDFQSVGIPNPKYKAEQSLLFASLFWTRNSRGICNVLKVF